MCYVMVVVIKVLISNYIHLLSASLFPDLSLLAQAIRICTPYDEVCLILYSSG